MGNKP